MNKLCLLLVLILPFLTFSQFPPNLSKTAGSSFGQAVAGIYSGFEFQNNINVIDPSNSYAVPGRDVTLFCNGNNTVSVNIVWHNPKDDATYQLCQDITFAVKIIRAPFSYLNTLQTSGNYYVYNPANPEYPYPDGWDDSYQEVIYNSGNLTTGTGNEPTEYEHGFSETMQIQIEGGYAYWVEVIWKKNHLACGNTTFWTTEITSSINVAVGDDTSVDLVPSNSVGTTYHSSYYGPMEVHQFDLGNQQVLFDASSSICANSYMFTLEEFDPINWLGLGTPYTSGWITGAPNQIDAASYLSLSPGKIYHVAMAVGPVWDSKDLFFAVKQAIADCDLQTVEDYHTVTVPQHGGGTAIYNVRDICHNLAQVYLDASSSQYESWYQVEVSEVNPTDMSDIGALATTSGTGPAPSNINVKAIYQNQVGPMSTSSTYRATLTVGDNPVSKSVYFDFITCDEPGGPRSQISTDFNEEESSVQNIKVKSFPNPTSGLTTVLLDGYVMDELGPIQLNVFNSMGQLVYEKQVIQNQFDIDLSEAPAGMYTIKIQLSTEVFVVKVLKQ